MYDHLHYGSSCEFLHITEYELLSWGSVSASIRMERGRDLGQSGLGSFRFFFWGSETITRLPVSGVRTLRAICAAEWADSQCK